MVTAMFLGDFIDAGKVWDRLFEGFCDDLGPHMARYESSPNDLEDPQTDLGLYRLNELSARPTLFFGRY